MFFLIYLLIFPLSLINSSKEANVHLVIANDYNKEMKYEPIIHSYEGFKNFTLIHPPKSTQGVFYSVFHPKLWLLKFPDFLRVVVGSGNLTVGDWTVWSNCLWFQDFIRKDNKFFSQKKSNKEEEHAEFDFDKDFKDTLTDFVKNIMPKGVDFNDLTTIDLNDYVFENIDVILISSIPGRYPLNNSRKYGLLKLQETLKRFPIDRTDKKMVNLTYQTTSLGTVDSNFLGDFHFSLLNNGSQSTKVIYPTEKYVVEDSYGGPECAQPLCLNAKNFTKNGFQKETLCKFEGNDQYAFHQGILPHLKVGIINKVDTEINDETAIYYGSHNFTVSAWGKFEKNRSQILISNTELGILVPPKKGSQKLKKEIVNGFPFRYPPNKYEKEDKPWISELFFKE